MDTANEKTYSESWYRVASLQIALHPAIKIRKQLFRGQSWYVIHDPFNNHFFRLQPSAYRFISRLNKNCTVDEIWQHVQQTDPQNAPSQNEVIHLLAQLYHANVLRCELPVDSVKIFERYQHRQQRESRSQLLQLMFFRIPLFDPNAWLDRCASLVHWLTSKLALWVWITMMVLAGRAILEQSPQFLAEMTTVLAINNLILLYASLILIKLWHEIGHTLVCKRFGGEVHTVGVMFMIFAPFPYMDATSSWAFRQRRQRILVSLAGILFELFAAAGAALVWANTGSGTVHSLALNLVIVGSVSSIVFNGNPLLRYDGYYALSDALDIPNLHQRSTQQLKYLSCRYLFGSRHSYRPEKISSEAIWLTTYGIISGGYRFIVYGGIILFVSDRYLMVGALMALFCITIWGVFPLSRFIRYVVTSPELGRCRFRALLTTSIAIIVVISGLGSLPVSNRFRAPGVVEAVNFAQVSSQSAGRLTHILAVSGTEVTQGQPLLQMENPELDIEIRLIESQRAEIQLLQQKNTTSANDRSRLTLQRRLQALNNRVQELKKRQQQLLIRAEVSGKWCAPEVELRLDSWLARGELLGQIVSTKQFNFTAVVNQDDAAYLFADAMNQPATIRLNGLEQHRLNAISYQILPFEQQRLPSSSLGWQGGGEIAVADHDTQGLQTLEPFFKITATLSSTHNAIIRHGHSGQIRFSLKDEPILTQLYRRLKQFIQKRYQV